MSSAAGSAGGAEPGTSRSARPRAAELRRALHAAPTLFRVGLAEMVAYRAEVVIWFLTATLPLIMMLVWDRVAEEGPVGRFDQGTFASYFLATVITRQVTGAWIVWELNAQIREGTLSPLLLKPLHPLWLMAAENLTDKPIRIAVLVPLVVVIWLWRPQAALAVGPLEAPLLLASLALAWVLGFFIQVAFGALAFRVDQSLGLYQVWFGLWALLSGYLFPIELLPAAARGVLDLLPFRATLGIPVEIATGGLRGAEALGGVALQAGWTLVAGVVARWLWRAGIRRYEAYGA